MGQPISLFPDYFSKENAESNYCGLVLKMLYEESPGSLEEVLRGLLPDSGLEVGPSFQQQVKAEKSIPDLVITQVPFTVFFETKRTPWFYTDQLSRHVESFGGGTRAKALFALSNYDSDDYKREFCEKHAADIKKALAHNVILEPLSFEDFLAAVD